jgi:hypothetical protein
MTTGTRSAHPIILSIALATGTLACQRAGTGEQAPPATSPDAARLTFEQRREAFVRNVQARMTELDTEIARLRQRAAVRSREIDAESKAAMDDAISVLEKRRAESSEMLRKAGVSTQERWEETKKATRATVKRVEDATADAWRRLRR